jgi:hypothetical protein
MPNVAKRPSLARISATKWGRLRRRSARPRGREIGRSGIDGRTLAAGRQVVGSYRLTPNSDWTPTDCFGAPAVCESGNPEPVYE